LTSNDRRSFPFISAWLPEQCHKLSEEWRKCVQAENRLNPQPHGLGFPSRPASIGHQAGWAAVYDRDALKTPTACRAAPWNYRRPAV
jgi:hypothetical protein